MKTGNTTRVHTLREAVPHASMEPGHEDREYTAAMCVHSLLINASMEPGHEDREYDFYAVELRRYGRSLNGARS